MIQHVPLRASAWMYCKYVQIHRELGCSEEAAKRLWIRLRTRLVSAALRVSASLHLKAEFLLLVSKIAGGGTKYGHCHSTDDAGHLPAFDRVRLVILSI